jgi:molecular chaperone GrpE
MTMEKNPENETNKVSSENIAEETLTEAPETGEGKALTELEKAQTEIEASKDKYIRLYSEFENFRRRTAKEKIEMVQTANESVIKSLLPVLDDFERAESALKNPFRIKPIKTSKVMRSFLTSSKKYWINSVLSQWI